MNYINGTLLNDLQGSNVTNDKRFSPLGYVNLAADSTDAIDYILPSQIDAMNKMSSMQNQKIPVIKDQDITVVETPGFNFIPSNLEETDQYGWTAIDIFSGMRHYESTYANNMVDAKDAAKIKTTNICYAMGQALESKISTVLEARKTQVLAKGLVQISQGDGTFTFSTVTDTLSVSKAAQKETMFFKLERLMKANDLGGAYRIVTNQAGLAEQISQQLRYNTANSDNKNALGMFPLDHMYESANLTEQAGEVFTGFLVRDGAIGLIPNFPFDFRMETKVDGKTWKVSDVEMPFCRVPVNVYTNEQATDASSLITPVAGVTDSNTLMTTYKEIAFWLRVFIVYRYNSNIATRTNDIVKIVGLTT